MNAIIWGPLYWKFFESVAYHAPKKEAIEFLQVFQYLLPCKYCRASYKTILAQLPIPTTATQYIYAIHAEVNKKLKKENLPYKFFAERLHAFRASLCPEDVNNFLLTLISNYDHNPELHQEAAWRKMWKLLSVVLQPILPTLASAMKRCSLPEDTNLSTGRLKEALAFCSLYDLRRINVMRVKSL